MMGTKTIYNERFKNILCIPFIKHLMINVRKILIHEILLCLKL